MHASNSFSIIQMTMRSRILGITIMTLVANCATDHKGGTFGSPVAGEWHARTIDGRPTINAGSVPSPRILFRVDSGRVTGSTGCNYFAGPYSISGASLTFGALAMTRILCEENAGRAQEAAFTAALNETTSFAISADTLTLFAGSAPRLRFTRRAF
jgi:heat shock protein HslJ